MENSSKPEVSAQTRETQAGSLERHLFADAYHGLTANAVCQEPAISLPVGEKRNAGGVIATGEISGRSDLSSAAVLAPLALLAVPGMRNQAFKSLAAGKMWAGEITEKICEKLGTKIELAGVRFFLDAAPVVENKGSYAFRGSESKYSPDLPPVFSLSDLNLEKLVSGARRTEIAVQSPLYDVKLAQSFTLGLRQELAPFLKETREAYKPLASDYKLFGEFDKSVPEYRQFRQSIERFQPLLAGHAGKLADELAIPRVKVAIDFADEAGPGLFNLSSATLRLGYRQFLRPSKLAEVVYHESSHVEQTNLVLRELADRLGIGKEFSPADLRNLNQLAKKELRFTEDIDSDYLSQVLTLRKGEPLASEQLKRARELRQSLAATGEGEKPVNELEDERLREYWTKTGRQTITDFLEKDGEKLAEDSAMYGWRFKPVTKSFVDDYRRGKGDLSRLDLSLEDSAHAEMRSFFEKAVLKNNRARAFNLALYRTSTHEIEAHELGQLTLKFR